MTIEDLEENLHIALSLARGNSPAIKGARRLKLIANHIEKALRIINGQPITHNHETNEYKPKFTRTKIRSHHA